MNFSKISKFFVAGVVLSSFCFANASEAEKVKSAPVVAKAEEGVASDKKEDSQVDANVVSDNEKSKPEGDVSKVTNADGLKNLGSVSVKNSESCSESSFVIEQNSDGSIVVRDIGADNSSENPDVVSSTKVYTRRRVRVYNVFYDPASGIACEEKDSLNSSEPTDVAAPVAKKS